jgi:hypothetical protein
MRLLEAAMSDLRAVMVLLATMAGATSSSAVPTFTWDGPWNVTLDPVVIEVAGSGRRAFGAGTTTDGQILGVNDDAAVAKVFARADPGDEAGTFASSRVSFSRQFTLSGSQQGWAVSLTGDWSGVLSGDGNFRTTAQGNIASNVTIPGGGFINVGPQASAASGGPFVFPYASVVTDTQGLFDGTYTVEGFIEASAQTYASVAGTFGAFAQSDYFDAGALAVSLRVMPGPEQATAWLMLAGLGCLVAWGRRRRGTP